MCDEFGDTRHRHTEGPAKRVILVFFDAGGGHRATAMALREAIRSKGCPWIVDLLNLGDVLISLDPLNSSLGFSIAEFYNSIARNALPIGIGYSLLLRILTRFIQTAHPRIVRLLREQWLRIQPNLVVSLIPLFNRALKESLSDVAFVTVLTDLINIAPHFWIERQDQFLICGSPEAVRQAHSAGLPRDLVLQTSGMVIHPRFYAQVDIDVRSERQRLGLDPTVSTGIAMWGAHGSKSMFQLAKSIQDSELSVQMIFVCGKNNKLVKRLEAYPTRIRKVVVGETSEVDYYLRISDFFIGKPGSGCISEALAMSLPMTVEANWRTPPQERYNATWLEENQLGTSFKNCRQAATAVQSLLGLHETRKDRAASSLPHNCAVWEVVEIFRSILEPAE